jgi:hypothetical protein
MNGRPGGWYHGWNIVAVCILLQAVANGLTYNAFSLFLPDWAVELHAPVSQLHLAIAAMALLAAFSAPEWAYWRTDSRRAACSWAGCWVSPPSTS